MFPGEGLSEFDALVDFSFGCLALEVTCMALAGVGTVESHALIPAPFSSSVSSFEPGAAVYPCPSVDIFRCVSAQQEHYGDGLSISPVSSPRA